MATRIAHLTTVHHPEDPRIFRKQLVTLAEAGFEAHLLAPGEGDVHVRQGVHVTPVPVPDGRYRRLLAQPDLVRAARQLDAALYHFHDPELIPAAYALKRLTGARVVYDMHENYRWHGAVEGRLLRALENWCFRWADHVVVANAAHRGIPAAAGADATVVANYYKPLSDEGPGEPPASEERPPLADFRAVYTGVMNAERGLETLVDLAARVRHERPRWRVDLVGVCYVEAERRRAEAQMHRLGAGPALRRTGWDAFVPWPQIARATRRAHAGLLLWQDGPHNRERIPTKFYEYLAAGLPIVCTDLPRWRALVERHGCGAVVPAGDARAAFAVLERWAADPEHYAALADRARAAGRAYRWPIMGRRLVSVYRRLLGE